MKEEREKKRKKNYFWLPQNSFDPENPPKRSLLTIEARISPTV